MKTAKELKVQATEIFNDIFGLSYEKPSDIRDYLLYKIFSFNHEAKKDLEVNGRSKEFWIAVEKWSFSYSESLVAKEIKEEISFEEKLNSGKCEGGAMQNVSIGLLDGFKFSGRYEGDLLLVINEHSKLDFNSLEEVNGGWSSTLELSGYVFYRYSPHSISIYSPTGYGEFDIYYKHKEEELGIKKDLTCDEEVKEVTGYIIGDFVEIFTQTEDIADKTGMHVATKTDGRKIVGFPSHAIARYTQILLNAGYKLMVVNDKELKNELTFDEVRKYAQKVFPYLEISDNKNVYDAIMNWRDNDYLKNPHIKEGEEFLTALPLWELNNSNKLNTKLATEYLAEYLAYIGRREFDEVREYAENAGYALTELSECEYCHFSLYSTNRVGEFTALVDVVETIKDGRLLNKEFCDLPTIKDCAIALNF